jgi:hypothetical protein
VGKAPKAKPAMSQPLAAQPDLFAQAATRQTKISDAAMAAFRDADGAALPHPASAAPPAAAETPPAETPRRRRQAKGI